MLLRKTLKNSIEMKASNTSPQHAIVFNTDVADPTTCIGITNIQSKNSKCYKIKQKCIPADE